MNQYDLKLTPSFIMKVLKLSLTLALLSGCTSSGELKILKTQSDWVETSLYFSLGNADDPDQRHSEHIWQDFLDREVTPRFPDGLSVVEVYGQWKDNRHASLQRLRSKLLIIAYLNNSANRNKINQIRSAWKQKTGSSSVLQITTSVNISF